MYDGEYNEGSAYLASIRQGHWCHEDASKCPCGGGGWFLSELDVWVACRLHDGPHPEWLDAYRDALDEGGDVSALPALPALPEAPVWEDDGIPF